MQSLTLGQEADHMASFHKIQSIEDINPIEVDQYTSHQMESQRQKLDELEQMAIDVMEDIWIEEIIRIIINISRI